ncbi:E3 ubiquitin-protein ligase [Gossypium australe]|uniref:RING-type E3 ubiquitin transferase n=1 Tax=Gossypium australe TaxID=47621 RepID=A0A5B6V1Z4_9ROSI|nr:E3 ubiquitin-protein ligase [Gossypium australe]
MVFSRFLLFSYFHARDGVRVIQDAILGPDANPSSITTSNTRASDRHVPLSSRNATASTLSTGLLVDTNLEVSVPDAYRPPPAPIPFDAALGHTLTPSAAQGIHSSKSDEAVQTTNIGSGQETVVNTQETCIKSDDAKELDCKAQDTTENESSKELEIELSKPVGSIVPTKEEEDCCPTCLEEYDEENPKIITKCEHHFHLACIFEWMERSETCPVCDKL